jgi:hypothetical protein
MGRSRLVASSDPLVSVTFRVPRRYVLAVDRCIDLGVYDLEGRLRSRSDAFRDAVSWWVVRRAVHIRRRQAYEVRQFVRQQEDWNPVDDWLRAMGADI